MTTITDTDVVRSGDVATEAGPAVRLDVEYWTVNMDGQASCETCDDTLTLVNGAVDTIRPLAERIGLGVDLVPRSVTTWAEAVGHGIAASPTVRAVGVELRPVHPDGSETRVWEWRGATSASANSEAILDFLVRAIAVRSEQVGDYLAAGGPAPYVRQFLHATPQVEEPASASCGCGPSS